MDLNEIGNQMYPGLHPRSGGDSGYDSDSMGTITIPSEPTLPKISQGSLNQGGRKTTCLEILTSTEVPLVDAVDVPRKYQTL
jgi:hypothetical protein